MLDQPLNTVAPPDDSAFDDPAKQDLPFSSLAMRAASQTLPLGLPQPLAVLGQPRCGARKSLTTRGLLLISCGLPSPNVGTNVLAIVHAIKMNPVCGLIS